MQQTETYQDQFLNQLRKDHAIATIFLVNGFQIRGVVTAFDAFVIFLLADGKQEMIYKHAVSTIIPSNSVTLG